MANAILDSNPVKFLRDYQLLVETSGNGGPKQTITIKLPFTVEFDITRTYFSSANASSIRIYNLSKEHRNQIRHDQNAYYVENQQVLLKAGYQGNLATTFFGTIGRAWSVREGTNMITNIEAFDGGSAQINGRVNKPYKAGTTITSIIRDMADTLPGVEVGYISTSFNTPLTKGASFSGPTMDMINQLTSGVVFVDNNRLYVLAQNESITGDVKQIDKSNGLLGTPIREFSNVYFDMIFEPRLIVGQRVRLVSEVSEINANFVISRIHHRGMISPVVCGDAITSVGLIDESDLTEVRRGG